MSNDTTTTGQPHHLGTGDARDPSTSVPPDHDAPPAIIDQLCAELGPELAPVVDAQGRVLEVVRPPVLRNAPRLEVWS